MKTIHEGSLEASAVKTREKGQIGSACDRLTRVSIAISEELGSRGVRLG